MAGDDTDVLYTVDTVSGTATRVGSANLFGVGETSPAGLAAIGDTLYMTGDDTDALYILNTSHWRGDAGGKRRPAFDVGETSPAGLAAIGDTLYMTGDDTDALYKAQSQ